MSGKELDDMTLEKIIKLILQDVLCTVFIVVKLFHQGAFRSYTEQHMSRYRLSVAVMSQVMCTLVS
jgi:hypothetical protein